MSEEQPSVTDLLADMQIIMERFGRGERLALDGDRDSVLVLTSAVLAVAGELREVRNVLHEINMKIEAIPVKCRRCNGRGHMEVNEDGIHPLCPVCDGHGKVMPEEQP